MADLVGPIQFKRGTSAEWASATVPLAAGELGVDLTLMRVKIGDGATLWPALPWTTPDSATIAALQELADVITAALTATDAAMTAVDADESSAFSIAQRARYLAGRVVDESGTVLPNKVFVPVINDEGDIADLEIQEA